MRDTFPAPAELHSTPPCVIRGLLCALPASLSGPLTSVHVCQMGGRMEFREKRMKLKVSFRVASGWLPPWWKVHSSSPSSLLGTPPLSFFFPGGWTPAQKHYTILRGFLTPFMRFSILSLFLFPSHMLYKVFS